VTNTNRTTMKVNLQLLCYHVKPNGIPLCYDNSYMPHMYIS